MVSKIIRIALIAVFTATSGWQFFEGNIGNGIFAILLAGIVVFTYFKNERMILAMLALRKNNMGKASKHLSAIKDPDHALVKSQRATYYFLQGVVRSQTNMTEAEKCYRRALEIGLPSKEEKAMAKLQLAAVAMQKGRKTESEALLAEVKKLDTKKLLEEQVTYIKGGLKRMQQPGFYQQQQAKGVKRR